LFFFLLFPPPPPPPSEELRDLRTQLRQLVESLRNGSSGLSLVQVKHAVASLRARIAAVETLASATAC